MASWIGLVRILASFGSDALAGYTIGMRIVMFALLPSLGHEQRGGDDGGPGARRGNPNARSAAVWMAARYNLVFLGGRRIGLRVVRADDRRGASRTTRPWRRTASGASASMRTGSVFYAYGMVIANSFNGAGDTWTPTWINLFVFWLWRSRSHTCCRTTPVGAGVFVAMTIAFSTLAVVSAIVFRKGRWKRMVV